MSVTVVARKDFQDSIRSRWLIALTILFAFVATVVTGALVLLFQSEQVRATQLINIGWVTNLVPLIALVMAYGAVVDERESGSLKLLLALPHSRADVVFGKVIGRTGSLAVALTVGLILPAVVGTIGPVTLDPAVYLGYLFLTIVLATAFVAIAVGFSAATASNRLAVAGAVGIYLLFVVLWGPIRFGLEFLFVTNGAPEWLPITGQELLDVQKLVNPVGAFDVVSTEFTRDTLFASGVDQMWGTSAELAAVVVLLAWIVLPPVLGTLRFQVADL